MLGFGLGGAGLSTKLSTALVDDLSGFGRCGQLPPACHKSGAEASPGATP